LTTRQIKTFDFALKNIRSKQNARIVVNLFLFLLLFVCYEYVYEIGSVYKSSVQLCKTKLIE